MKKEIRNIDKKKGIVQVTTFDERWYAIPSTKKGVGIPEYKFLPSVTWIAEHYPKGIAFYKWLAGKGWDEAEALKQAAGDKGSRVHLAVEEMLAGNEIGMDTKFLNKSTGQQEELTLEEWKCLMDFQSWFQEVKPEIIAVEYVVVNEKEEYAGTIDMKVKIGNKVGIIDLKTSQNIWPSYELQLSAYKKAEKDKIDFLAILQVGYQKNKNGWKFTELQDKYDLFLAAKKIWLNENKDKEPQSKDYPLALSLGIKVVEPEKELVKTHG